jgi:hypothetical protein
LVIDNNIFLTRRLESRKFQVSTLSVLRQFSDPSSVQASGVRRRRTIHRLIARFMHSESHPRKAASHLNATRRLESIQTLARFGARGDRCVDRPALSPIDIKARRDLIDRARAPGRTVRTDACRACSFPFQGLEDPARVKTGSYIDPNPPAEKSTAPMACGWSNASPH